MPTVDLATALRILVLIASKEPESYERAAVRWAGRLMADRSQLGLEGAADVLDDLAGLFGHERSVAASRLAFSLRGVGEVQAAMVLERG